MLDLARAIADAAEAEAKNMGLAITIMIFDPHGNPVLLHRMEGARAITLTMAERKAYTAAMLSMPTATLGQMAQPGQPMAAFLMVDGGKYIALGGGVPIFKDGVSVGGVGVSGGSAEQDAELAEKGIAAAGAKSSA